MAEAGCYLTEGMVTNWGTATPAEIKAIIDKVEQWIDKVTGTIWCETELDIELNGNGKNRLFLPLETDILTVTNVYIDCIEIPSSWYTWDVNSVYLDPCASGNGMLDPELYYKVAEAAGRGIFVRGYNNIRVVGTMGEILLANVPDDIPELIKQAAVILASWENDPSGYATLGLFKSEKIGDYSYTAAITAEEDILTGVMEADMRLRPYVKRKAILMAP